MSLLRVTFFVCAALLLGVFVVPSTGQSRRVRPVSTPTPRAEDVERVATEEIKLNVLAFDEAGRFFSGVGDNDIVITENNILHQPSSVRRLPANVLIVLDTGGELRQIKSLDQTRRTARALLSALRPDDSVAVLQYNDRAEIISEWTNDKRQIDTAIARRTNFGRRSAFVDALVLAREFLIRAPVENKHLVLITDGTDSSGNSSAKFDAMQKLLSTDISVHVISYGSMEAADLEPRTKMVTSSPPPKAMPDEVAAQLPNGVRDVATAPKARTINLDRTLLRKLKARKTDLEISERELEKLAENTNGEFIAPASLDEMVEKSALVAKMIDSSYVVTYTPKIAVHETRGIAERVINVTSKRPGLIVQARRKLVIDGNGN